MKKLLYFLLMILNCHFISAGTCICNIKEESRTATSSTTKTTQDIRKDIADRETCELKCLELSASKGFTDQAEIRAIYTP